MQNDKPKSDDLSAATILLSGKAPGGDFRKYATENAQELSLTGFGQELSDGLFKIVVEGKKSSIQTLIGYIELSRAFDRIVDVQVSWSSYSSKYSDFSIKE